MSYPLPGVIRGILGRKMLVACEVAVEYYLAMSWSPQVQWMRTADDAWPLQVRGNPPTPACPSEYFAGAPWVREWR